MFGRNRALPTPFYQADGPIGAPLAPVTPPVEDTLSGGEQNLQQQVDDKNKFDSNQDMWQTPKAKEPVISAKPAPSLDATFSDYVKDLDFGINLTPNHFDPGTNEDGSVGTELTALNSAMQAGMQGMYKKLLGDMTAMLQAHGTRLETQVMGRVNNSQTTRDAVASLNTAIPSAADPNIAPVAQAAKAAFLRNGDSDEIANEKTQQFLAYALETLAPDLNLTVAPQGSPGTRPYQNRPQSETKPDWAAIMMAKPE